MILKLTILISLLTLTLQAAPSSLPDKSQAMRELRKKTTYQEGAKAMADHLPDLAIRQFSKTLENKNLSQTARPYAILALAEALIKASITNQGNDQQATQALQLLTGKEVKNLPSTPIWKSEALAALGHYQEAEKTLATIPPSHPQYAEVQLARARILIALTHTEHALKLLTSLITSQSSALAQNTRNNARLIAAEILINQKNFQKALEILDEIGSQNPSIAQLREYLKARLSLANQKPREAVEQFHSLVTGPDHFSEKIYNACTLGLADALVANKQTDDAIALLVEYITQHPNSEILQPIFQRLGKWLPADLPANNPTMVKLLEWSGPPQPSPNILYIKGDRADAIPPYQPASSEYDDLVSLSLYLRAQLLARSTNTNNNQQALFLLTRLRTQHPGHTLPPSELYLHLASASLLDTAEIQLKRNQPQQAAFTLASMEKAAFSPQLKDQGSFLLGLLMAKEGNYKKALEAFNYARTSTSQNIATAASINTGITALLSGNLTIFDKIFNSPNNPRIQTALELERALWKCRNQDVSGRSDLDTFILNHPGHPRENEARLALAAASVDLTPPDITLAKAQLDVISPRLSDASSQFTITRIRIRAEELNENWEQAAIVAQNFITRFGSDPHIPGVMLKQGEAYYHNEDFNKARRVFQTLIDQFPDSDFTPYAKFYTAMAARLGGTTQAREESVELFQKIITPTHPLANEARIQQSRVLIDLRRYSEALTTLKPLFESKSAPIALHRDAGVLMADCLHRQAASDPQKYQQAVKIYDDLLSSDNLPLPWNNRLHFLRGQTLESMGKTEDALESYYSVIAKTYAPEQKENHDIEWFWFYRCGFQALSLLEAEKRWDAAVKLARRIASFNGPRAEEASKRANTLAKQHMIWEDDPPTASSNP